MTIQRFSCLVPAMVLAACGDGGGGGGGENTDTAPPATFPPPSSSILGGRFKDGNTEGLSYSTASQSGVTDEHGGFNYRSGETVEFSIGGVLLGSADAAAVITPVDLVADGSSSAIEVQNIVRFLLMLDQDGDSSDGITISQNVRDMAPNWSQVDFATADLDTELITIIADVASVDQRTPKLPDAAAGKAHLEQTVYCSMSGAFRGELTGDLSGKVFFLVYPSDGAMVASFIGSTQSFDSAAPPSVDQQRGFRLVRSGDDATFEGRYDTYDELSGVWTVGDDAGEFTASRLLGSPDASYRYSGTWDYGSPVQAPALVNVFDINAAGEVDARAYKIAGSTYTATGSANASALHVTWNSGSVSNGSIDPATLSLVGDWSNSEMDEAGHFAAEGCRLN